MRSELKIEKAIDAISNIRDRLRKLSINLDNNIHHDIPEISQYQGRDDEMYSCVNNTSLGTLIDKLGQYLSDVTNSAMGLNLKHKNRLVLGDRVECVFWDFDHKKWSSDGCHVMESESNRETTVCECNHLTNFAALMDTSGREDNRMDRKEC
ncbi:unnamed protein product, partial [Oppiella nova]